MLKNAPQQYKVALYVRKSSESEERQILSIDSQISHLRELAEQKGFLIKEIIEDAASAYKASNRPGFDLLMQRINQQQIDIILCWKGDRLARNMTEGGKIMDLLQEGKIKGILTPYQHYYPEDNILPLAIELGMAKQYSNDLSKNIKRGNKTKINRGGFCHRPPCGYLNNRFEKTIIKDPDRFKVVKKIFQLMLTKQYSMPQICTIANEQWGFKTRQTKRMGGNPLKVSTLHKILTNPFYYGLVRNGNHQKIGNHTPMISQGEFYKIKDILKSQGAQKPNEKMFFAYTNLFRCQECNCSITAEEKIKYNCPKCKKKQGAKNPKQCTCGFQITKKIIQKGRHYTYYRCTKKKKLANGRKCSQPCIRKEILEEQILHHLSSINLHTEFIEFAKKALDLFTAQENKQKGLKQKKNQQKQGLIEKQLINAMKMRMADEISAEQFLSLKIELEKEKRFIQKNKIQSKDWKKEAKQSLEQVQNIRKRFLNLSPKEKKTLLNKLGSNPTLFNQKLLPDWKKHYSIFSSLQEAKTYRLESPLSQSISDLNQCEKEHHISWWSKLDEVRTFLSTEKQE